MKRIKTFLLLFVAIVSVANAQSNSESSALYCDIENLSLLTTLNIEKLINGTYLFKILDASNTTIKIDKLLISK